MLLVFDFFETAETKGDSWSIEDVKIIGNGAKNSKPSKKSDLLFAQSSSQPFCSDLFKSAFTELKLDKVVLALGK